jgi:hypothetical protein
MTAENGSDGQMTNPRFPSDGKVIVRSLVDWVKTGQLRGPTEWSIGIYRGRSPLDMRGVDNNPVITRREVTDVRAAFVADPMMVQWRGTWHMFFEVANVDSGRGEIGLAVSGDGVNWHYERIVLVENHHLSFPFVFTYEDSVLMIPETSATKAIDIYEAKDFPFGWHRVHTIAAGLPYDDANVFYSSGRWWAIASTTVGQSVSIHVFHSESPLRDWVRHPMSGSHQIAGRSAGRVIHHDGMLIRPTQDSRRVYGEYVVGYRIDLLTPSEFRETRLESGALLAPSGVGWNAARMHTLDAHQLNDSEWIACVDGRGFAGPMAALSRALGGRLQPYEYPRTDA